MRTLFVVVVLAILPARDAAAPAAVTGPRAATSSVPTPAFAPDGTLWLAWVEESRVYVSSSPNLGQTFAPAVAVSAPGEAIDANGEARPKIAVGPQGDVYVSYTRKGQRPFTGDIRFSRRPPDGAFAEPITVNDDGLATGHRFDTLSVSPSGDVHMVWIDKRDVDAATNQGRAYDGAALYQAVSRDRGRSFSPNVKLKDGVCECCRLAVAWDGPTPLLLWRDLLEGGVRDHSIARLHAGGAPVSRRATDDGWKIDGCPHHGPALATGPDGTWHLAWFTGQGKRGAGAFYRRSADQGRSLTEPMRLGSSSAGRPTIMALGKSVWIAWKETQGGQTAIRAVRSLDAGLTWSGPRDVARTDGSSDHPFLIGRGADAFLSWFAAQEGYRLVRIN